MWFKRYVLVFVLAVGFISNAVAERYVVQDDAFGNTGAKELSSLDEDALKELEQKKTQSTPSSSESVSAPSSSNDAAPEVAAPSSASNIPPNNAEIEQTDDQVEPDVAPLDRQSEFSKPSELDQTLSVEQTEAAAPAPASSSDPFLREYQRTEAQETDEVIKRLRARPTNSDYDATLVDPADFVDSEDLLRGNVDSEGDQPFYITINAEGESDVIFYSPKVIQDEIDRLKFEEQISDAVIFLPSEQDQASIALPDGADPQALAILSGGEQASYFSRFTDRCCEGLPNVGVLKLKTEQSVFADFKRDDFSYRFVDGDSRYQLVRLPELRRKYLVTLKTFVKKYKRRGIDSGAFIPQVVILGRDKKVKRIISSMSSRSYAETWTSYGYLKSVIEIDQTELDADAFILLYTTADSLRRSTIIEDTSNQWEIKHMETGAVEVAIAESSL